MRKLYCCIARARLTGSLFTLSALLLTPLAAPVHAQSALSADPVVRASQQWEDLLLLEDFDYLQLTRQQCHDMQGLADYARTRMDEVEQQRARLQAAVDERHKSLLKGTLPTDADQADILQKQRAVADRLTAVSGEIVDRLAPKLGGILTRKQTVRAWMLIQNKLPPSEPKRSGLTDIASGFVLPQMEAHDVIEDLVKISLRKTYPPDVIEQGLTPWEFSSLAGLAGPFGGGAQNAAKAMQSIQDMDPRMGQRMLLLGQKMLRQYSGAAEAGGSPLPQIPPETRAALNRDAAALRKMIEGDPEAYLSDAQSEQMLQALRPLTRRLFLSPRIKEALIESEAKRGG